MGLLKPPGMISFLLATLLAILAFVSEVGLALPALQAVSFWLMTAAFGLLFVASLVRGL